MPSVTKQELFDYCRSYVTERIERIRTEISTSQTSANEETKSSAGDKHETARAMAQLEVEMNAKQLAEAEKLMVVLNKIHPSQPANVVCPGALVKTTVGLFYMAVSIGKVAVGKSDVFIISVDSPIGKQLYGKQKDDTVVFQGNTQKILEVL
jgi:transcription elongation GreA/GreB family factor